MGLLLDTHVVIWWFADHPQFPRRVRDLLESTDECIFVSAVCAFEMATKHRIGKLPQVAALLDRYAEHLADQGFTELPISSAHALQAGRLRFAHGDPFDRLLIAQAVAEGHSLVSNEELFDQTGVSRIWS